MNSFPYSKRTIHRHTLDSSVFPEGRTVKVWLPPDFSEDFTYPWLICHDGLDFLTMGRMATHATQLMADDEITPLLIVFVDIDKKSRNEQFHPAGSRFSDYMYFIAEELVPFVETNYPVKRTSHEKVMAGDSLSGTVSIHLALEYPELFSKVICLSGAMEPHTQLAIAMHNDLSYLHVWMTIGLQENEVHIPRGTFDFLTWNREARELLVERHAQLEYRERPGEHVWGFWQKETPFALRHFFGT